MTTTTRPPITIPAPGRYGIDSEKSQVTYTGRHMFGLGVVHATFRIREGELRIADPPEASSARAVIEAGSFHSSSPRRDRDVTSAGLLDAATYPEITFVSDGLRAEAEQWVLTGTVTAHGSTVPVTVLVDRVESAGDGFRVHGRAAHLDRHAFGITGSRGMVGRYLDLDLDVVAAPK